MRSLLLAGGIILCYTNKYENTYLLVRCRNGSNTLIVTDQNDSSDNLHLMGRGREGNELLLHPLSLVSKEKIDSDPLE